MTSGGYDLHFFYDAQNRPAIVSLDGISYVYMYNLQGDVIALIDSTGNLVVYYTYDAWGRITGRHGTLANSLGLLNPFRYRGYVYDEETGLYYLRSRYYNPQWNRFINSDALLNISSILGLNIYAYCNNIPVSFVDLDGMLSDAITTPYFKRNALAFSELSGGGCSGGVLSAGTWNLTHTLTMLFTPFVAFLFPSSTTFPTTATIPVQGEYSIAASVSIANPTDLSATSSELSPWEKPKEWHHIVAKKEENAKIAYCILIDLEIPINGSDNLVLLAYPVHRRLHTDAYYGYVNAVIKSAYKRGSDIGHPRESVLAALAKLRAQLEYMNLIYELGVY